ncbi:MAG: hypothetical protein ACJ8AT_39800 [Hyalangium sp.]|uniref:hypothetical protein n=1 Tax=Hyalangium sp. TaxID=2028555 RepID=UPI003899F7EC
MGSKSTSKVFPGFDKMFLLEEPGNSKAFRGDLDVETTDEAVGLTRAEMHRAHPITLKWAMGRAKPVEVIRTTYATPLIVADSVVQLLRSHGFTGWSLYEVSVHDKQGQRIPGYSGLAVTGRCGSIEWAKGVEVPRISPAGIFPVWKGLFFDPNSWDGSDFFMPTERFRGVLVVEEVKKAFERAKIRNVDFTPLDQFERSWRL